MGGYFLGAVVPVGGVDAEQEDGVEDDKYYCEQTGGASQNELCAVGECVVED